MVLRKCFYIRWSAGRSPRVHEVNPGWDPSLYANEMNVIHNFKIIYKQFQNRFVEPLKPRL